MESSCLGGSSDNLCTVRFISVENKIDICFLKYVPDIIFDVHNTVMDGILVEKPMIWLNTSQIL